MNFAGAVGRNDDEWWFGGRFGNGFYGTIPAFIAFAFLLAGLFSMTVIDARTFTIPIQIPLFVTATAFIAYPAQAIFPARVVGGQDWPIVTGDWMWTGVSMGGMVGVVISFLLLRLGKLRHSFADYNDYLTDDHEVLADYPQERSRGKMLAFSGICNGLGAIIMVLLLGRFLLSPPRPGGSRPEGIQGQVQEAVDPADVLLRKVTGVAAHGANGSLQVHLLRDHVERLR